MPHLNEIRSAVQNSEQLFTRDFQERVTPNDTQRTTLIVAGVYILVIGILW